MPRVVFEPTIPVLQRAKTVHAVRPRGHCDQLQVPIAVNIKVTFPWDVKLYIVMGTNISEQLAAS
jgi:hypothetical protein